MAYRTSLALVLLVALACAGCGTLENINRPCFPPPENPGAPVCRAYGGVRGDWELISEYPLSQSESYLDYVTIPVLAAFDLFFAAVADTITLPYTAVEEVRRAYYGPGGPPSSGWRGTPQAAEMLPSLAPEATPAKTPPANPKPPVTSPY